MALPLSSLRWASAGRSAGEIRCCGIYRCGGCFLRGVCPPLLHFHIFHGCAWSCCRSSSRFVSLCSLGGLGGIVRWIWRLLSSCGFLLLSSAAVPRWVRQWRRSLSPHCIPLPAGWWLGRLCSWHRCASHLRLGGDFAAGGGGIGPAVHSTCGTARTKSPLLALLSCTGIGFFPPGCRGAGRSGFSAVTTSKDPSAKTRMNAAGCRLGGISSSEFWLSGGSAVSAGAGEVGLSSSCGPCGDGDAITV